MTLNCTAEHRAATELFNLGTLLELKPVIFLFLHLLILHDRQTKENFFFCNPWDVSVTAVILLRSKF